MVADEGDPNDPTNLYEVNLSTGTASVLAQLDPTNLALEGFAVESAVTPAIPALSPWGVGLLSLLLTGVALAIIGARVMT